VCKPSLWLHMLTAQRATHHQLQQQKAGGTFRESTECDCGVRELGLICKLLVQQALTISCSVRTASGVVPAERIGEGAAKQYMCLRVCKVVTIRVKLNSSSCSRYAAYCANSLCSVCGSIHFNSP
jgi:hypothetical protein